MAYAKKCKYCNTTQVVWDDKLEGPNKFKEVETNLPHSRDRCDAAKTGGGLGLGKYSPQGQKEFVEQYRPEQKSEQKIPLHFDDQAELAIRGINTKLDNLNIAIAK